eukprot:scaffold398_cov177-Ochromonas_danica.AAC.5
MKLFSRSAISASRLSVNDGLAHIALPFGPHTFWPERKLITENLVDVKGEDDVNVSFSTFRQISLPFSFRGGSNPEESYCQFTWDKLMDMIETDLKDRLPQSSKKNVEKVSGRQITAAGLELFCATNSSAPEPVLTFTTLSFTLGLIAIYLMEDCFPCAVTLSEQLSVTDPAHIIFIHKWENCVLKPICSMHDMLWHNNIDARRYVHFPIGILGYPNLNP